jgi:hypothetical protein
LKNFAILGGLIMVAVHGTRATSREDRSPFGGGS